VAVKRAAVGKVLNELSADDLELTCRRNVAEDGITDVEWYDRLNVFVEVGILDGAEPQLVGQQRRVWGLTGVGTRTTWGGGSRRRRRGSG